jgi:plasmid stabilization system protein ParE
MVETRPLGLLFTVSALKELDAILSYIQAHSPSGARQVQSRIKALTDLLCYHPLAGQRTSRFPIRRIVATPYPYVLFYKQDETKIVIMSVRYAARKPLKSKSLE